MTLPLEGIKIIDFTVMQAGPVCTQLLGWLGADVLKIERPRQGDATRKQFRDIPGVDGLYFTMVNSNKRSLEVDTKTSEGKIILEELIQESDILVENLGPKSLEHMGFTWEHIHKLNPFIIFGSVKGFGENSRYADLKSYENIAQCAGGAASVTGSWDGPPTVAGPAMGDSNTGMHLTIGILAALRMRGMTGIGQKVSISMQDAVLNLCRMNLRDQLRIEKIGYLKEYPQFVQCRFGDTVPRGGNGAAEIDPGGMLKCKGWKKDPNAYMYLVLPDDCWEVLTQAISRPDWFYHPAYDSPTKRRVNIFEIFSMIENDFLVDKTKDEAVDELRKYGIPCSPVKSMKEIIEDPELRESETIIEVEHSERGKYLTVGCPVKFTGFKPQITQSPLLGEHTRDVLEHLGYSSAEINTLHKTRVVASTSAHQKRKLGSDEQLNRVRYTLEEYLKKNIYSNN